MRVKLLFLLLFFVVSSLVYSQSKYKSFKKLSCPEKWWVVWHPFVAKKAFSISQLARQKTDSIKQNKILTKRRAKQNK